ncbi:MAG TPA: sigma-54 dependent transcriptional regulator [Bacteroidota bacterium]|nr:sigma-54 dependent transcriptional regulator [Bacteroidota bacterium]
MADKLIYIVDDEATISKLLEQWVEKRWGYSVRLFSNGEALLERLDEKPDLILLDIMMPGIGGIESLKRVKERYPELPVIMLSAQGDVEVAVNALKLGATDYFSKPLDFPKLEIAIKQAIQLHDLTREVQRLREDIGTKFQFENIVSADGSMQEVFRLIEKVKDNDICVLVLGESGTGKELVSRAVHYNGKRKEGPFVVVNCASIPKELLESELFGHEKGAFTGAVQRRIGKFEQANGGTIFLDEIGEMDLSLQAKLLRVIQTKQFERVGGNETITSDCRVISATNKDLKQAVVQRQFREDLYFRLATFPIVLPPLRERKSDILVLSEFFLKKFTKELGKPELRFSKKALKLLYEYPWPGNVRELENAMQRAVVMAEGEIITEKELPLAVQAFDSKMVTSETPQFFDTNSPILPLEQVKEMSIRNALKSTNGNIMEAAKKLKVGRATLYRLMRKYKIEV